MTACSSCYALIIWAQTSWGKRIPLDQLPTENGNIVCRNGYALVLKKDEQPQPGELRYQSHFVSCPNAAKHRRKR